MPEEEVQEKQGQEEAQETAASKQDRGPIKLIGATVAICAAGALLAVMAVPSKPEVQRLRGPYPLQIIEKYQANPIDGNLTRFIQFTPHCEYYAYDKKYVETRMSDPFYMAQLKTALGRAVADKTLAEILEGIQRELFSVEVEREIAPVLFPVHIGDTKFPLDKDEQSGLGPGFSFDESTFRGLFYEHVLKLDAVARTIQIDDGPVISYAGDEQDLHVLTQAGESVFVDVAEVNPEFQGELHVGAHGRVRKLMILEPLAQ